MADYDYAPDDEQIVDVPSVDYTVFYSEGDWYGRDEHGQFQLQAGSREDPNEHPEDYEHYEPCGAVLKYTYDRYGERRYCTGMAVSNFAADKSYEYPGYCKRHQGQGYMKDQRHKQAKHLAFVESYDNMFQYFDAHEQVLAAETFKSLLEESKYDYETETHTLSCDATDTDLFDGDEFTIELPIPTSKKARAKSLWYASLDYVRMDNILEEQFRVAAEETGPDGKALTVGERSTIVTVTDEGREVEERDEHHLNLPLSRIQKDYERHLEVGGVDSDASEDVGEDEARTWILRKSGSDDTDESGDTDMDFQPDPDAA